MVELTAPYGGNHDELISLHDLKYVVVFQNANDVPDGMPIDNNDDCARNKSIKAFALLDNFKNKKKG